MNNILLIDKQKGITSFDVIRVLRKKLGVRTMGHAGTLDPLATGLLVVGVGDGTKKLSGYLGLPKTYEAEIRLGTRTDTGDTDGTVIEEKVIPSLSDQEVAQALKEMEGTLDLQVPIYSAIKRGGKPLYHYAREGLPIEIPRKKMQVREARLVRLAAPGAGTPPVITAHFDVGSGTYIRSLAEELARRLGTIGTIQNLRRLSVGDFHIRDARTTDSFPDPAPRQG